MSLYDEIIDSIFKINPKMKNMENIVLYVNRDFMKDVNFDAVSSVQLSDPRDDRVYGFKFFIMPDNHKRINAAFYY